MYQCIRSKWLCVSVN